MKTSPPFFLALLVVLVLGTGAPAAGEIQERLQVGDVAPDFVLQSADGATSVRLSELRGKPVVLFFGSCTCFYFAGSVGEMAEVCAAHPGRVHAYAVYTGEAHPNLGFPTPPSDAPPRLPTNQDRSRDVVAWTAGFGLIGGVGLVLLLLRTLGARRLVLSSSLLGAAAVAGAAAFVLTSPRDPPPPNTTDLLRPPLDPKTQEERNAVAARFAREFRLAVPVLVDGMDNKVGEEYGALPVRIFVIDQGGKVAYISAAGPGGFNVPEVRPVLDRLLAEGAE